MELTKEQLINKYNIAGPRYTSYPTVPYWDTLKPDQPSWQDLVKLALKEKGEDGISLYIHLPFCESLCTYCGCNTRITVNHAVETPYLEAVLKEFDMYAALSEEPIKIREIHLGGGTPTFFSPENLHRLLSGILSQVEVMQDADLGFEGHPNNTTLEHLQVLFKLGFKRVSFGVQDLDPVVQKAINRVQPFENVVSVTEAARATGYSSVNFDLVYGLPFQNLKGLINTVEKVIQLMPDRIAFYSYAHVPWKHPGQRRYTEKDLPEGEEKRALYERGKEMLLQAGYKEIGMDHFALPDDRLYKAAAKRTMHRNFMGYTARKTEILLGLGVSSISDIGSAFGQNHKVVEQYRHFIDQDTLAVVKQHVMTEEDMVIRQIILDLACRSEASIQTASQECLLALERLKEPEEDGLVIIEANTVKVTEKGKAFIRNICMAFDARLWRQQPEQPLFSKTA